MRSAPLLVLILCSFYALEARISIFKLLGNNPTGSAVIAKDRLRLLLGFNEPLLSQQSAQSVWSHGFNRGIMATTSVAGLLGGGTHLWSRFHMRTQAESGSAPVVDPSHTIQAIPAVTKIDAEVQTHAEVENLAPIDYTVAARKRFESNEFFKERPVVMSQDVQDPVYIIILLSLIGILCVELHKKLVAG